jgi:hypothetical protein
MNKDRHRQIDGVDAEADSDHTQSLHRANLQRSGYSCITSMTISPNRKTQMHRAIMTVRK